MTNVRVSQPLNIIIIMSYTKSIDGVVFDLRLAAVFGGGFLLPFLEVDFSQASGRLIVPLLSFFCIIVSKTITLTADRKQVTCRIIWYLKLILEIDRL